MILRQAIRLTWGQDLKNDFKTEYFFAVGFENEKLDSLVKSESFVNRDIIFMENHQEFYENLSNKTIKLFQWYYKYCSQSIGLLKVDDNVYLNAALMWKILNSYSRLIITEPLIIGKVFYKPDVIRQNSKFAISEEVYKENKYPSYATGGGYFVNSLAVKLLVHRYLQNNKQLFIWEDVAVTGILAEECGIALYNSFQMFSQLNGNLCVISVTIVTHNMVPSQLVAIWKSFHNNSKNYCQNIFQKYIFIL